MAKTPEGFVKEAVKEILKEYGAYFFMPLTYGYGASGVPDIIACYKGRFIAIECKAGNNQPTALQYRNMQKIVENEGEVLIVNEISTEKVRLLLNKIFARWENETNNV